ncbi:hypothetical protein EVAR_57274_1 [Eumeta japonica]|uniref:Uncharacterized protein n=1 Tax=Eumeta variegata TaxID=151549 RepID=A0A4C1ZRE3_EUMVA|nr:hypothetical protein EVAR_57274_1 [Eumeta japonica]
MCGLVPWNPDAIDYSKYLGKKVTNDDARAILLETYLSYGKFQDIIGPKLARKLKNNNIGKSVEAKALWTINKYFNTTNEQRSENRLSVEKIDILIADGGEEKSFYQEERNTDFWW